jgi:hypothetical protein
VNTVVLLTSSLTMVLGIAALERGRARAAMASSWGRASWPSRGSSGPPSSTTGSIPTRRNWPRPTRPGNRSSTGSTTP